MADRIARAVRQEPRRSFGFLIGLTGLFAATASLASDQPGEKLLRTYAKCGRAGPSRATGHDQPNAGVPPSGSGSGTSIDEPGVGCRVTRTAAQQLRAQRPRAQRHSAQRLERKSYLAALEPRFSGA